MNKGYEILTKIRKSQLLKIVYRIGYERYILDGKFYLPSGEKIGYWSIDKYNPDLLPYDRDKELEIMKIMDCTGKVLWERPRELPKLSPDEKAILRSLPEKYKYIVRDEDGHLGVFTDKPIKDDDEWIINIGKFESLSIFNHLFQSIQWEDEKPYFIKELLEG